MAAQISSYLAGLARLTVRSTTDTSRVGTRMDMPVSLPLSSGMTLPTALAAPVEEGMMLPVAARPPRQSFKEGPSTVFWVAVTECTVVIRPSVMPQLSFSTLAMGARQLVVQEALDTKFMSVVYLSRLTPHTNMGVSSLEGADMMTFLAPASRCPWAFSFVRNRPVDSTTYSAPSLAQGRSAGFRSAETGISLPLTTMAFSVLPISALQMPCMVSYFSI